MKGHYSKKLQNNSTLYTELQENQKLYYEYSFEKENKQKSFLKYNQFINTKTGETLQLDYDFEKKYKEYSKITEQRALTIQELAKRNNMCSVFITLTLPSAYHPFKSIKTPKGRLYVEENEEFQFFTIKEAVENGYKKLNTIYQTFYKRLKNYVKNDLYYIKVIENHNTMIPHCHLVLYFPPDCLDYVKNLFKKVVREFELDRVDFEQVSFKNNINYASKYLLKYIIKDLNNGADIFKARVLDGWKRYHKLRVLTSSLLPLNVMVYKKIYSSISFVEKNKIIFKINDNIVSMKEKIDNEVQKLGLPLYLYFQDNFSIQKIILDKNNERKITNKGENNSLFKVEFTSEKKTTYYKIKSFQVLFDNQIIYKKNKFIKIHN
jgi:hypothetical protein